MQERANAHPKPHHPDPALPSIGGVSRTPSCQGDGCGWKCAEGHGGGRHTGVSVEAGASQPRTVRRTNTLGGTEGSGEGAWGTQLSDPRVTFVPSVAPRVPAGPVTHRPEGSSRSPGSTGSGRSSSSCAGSTGTSRSPPGRRRGRPPGSPGRQTPTLEDAQRDPSSRRPAARTATLAGVSW